MCLSPVTLTRDNRDVHGELTYEVPCGRCYLCLKKRQKEWTFRMMQEAKRSSSVCFVTLTYENPPLSTLGVPTLEKKDYQNFMKKLRKRTHNKLKYYACGEYGDKTKRPHYHAIIFNLPLNWTKDRSTLTEIWDKGIVDVAKGNDLTMAYTAKYIMKKVNKIDEDFVDMETGEVKKNPEFSLMSKRMGSNFLTPLMRRHLLANDLTHIKKHGYPMAMPRYFREQLYTEEQRAVLSARGRKARQEVIEKKFNGDHRLYYEWKKDQIRKHNRSLNEERIKL